MGFSIQCSVPGCNNSYHSCSSCGLTESEEKPYSYGMCNSCWKDSGAERLFDDLREKLENELDKCVKKYKER
jgi:hypothetical protein